MATDKEKGKDKKGKKDKHKKKKDKKTSSVFSFLGGKPKQDKPEEKLPGPSDAKKKKHDKKHSKSKSKQKGPEVVPSATPSPVVGGAADPKRKLSTVERPQKIQKAKKHHKKKSSIKSGEPVPIMPPSEKSKQSKKSTEDTTPTLRKVEIQRTPPPKQPPSSGRNSSGQSGDKLKDKERRHRKRDKSGPSSSGKDAMGLPKKTKKQNGSGSGKANYGVPTSLGPNENPDGPVLPTPSAVLPPDQPSKMDAPPNTDEKKKRRKHRKHRKHRKSKSGSKSTMSGVSTVTGTTTDPTSGDAQATPKKHHRKHRRDREKRPDSFLEAVAEPGVKTAMLPPPPEDAMVPMPDKKISGSADTGSGKGTGSDKLQKVASKRSEIGGGSKRRELEQPKSGGSSKRRERKKRKSGMESEPSMDKTQVVSGATKVTDEPPKKRGSSSKRERRGSSRRREESKSQPAVSPAKSPGTAVFGVAKSPRKSPIRPRSQRLPLPTPPQSQHHRSKLVDPISSPVTTPSPVPVASAANASGLRVNINEVLRIGSVIERYGMDEDRRKAFEWLSEHRSEVASDSPEAAYHLMVALGDLVLSRPMLSRTLHFLVDEGAISPEEYQSHFVSLERSNVEQNLTVAQLSHLLTVYTGRYRRRGDNNNNAPDSPAAFNGSTRGNP
uniref:DUF4596 domain-containing protein n=1 Tax=Panagrellus redivivus TaxID=6233 RepID=A0A7E4VSL1_PANRE